MARQPTPEPAPAPAPAPTDGAALDTLLENMDQSIAALAARTPELGVKEWRMLRNARRSINELIGKVEGREHKAE